MKRSALLLPLAVAALLLACLTLRGSPGAAQAPDDPPNPRGDRALGWIDAVPLPGAAPSPPAPAEGQPAALPTWWRIAFQSYRDGNWEVYLANGDGSNQVRLTDHPDVDLLPRLNRGCTKVAFASDRDGDLEIYAMNTDGSGLTQLTANTADDVFPAWSSDGARLAFQSYRDGNWEVYAMNADGSGQVRVTNNPAYDGEPGWSPDGSQLAFVSDRGGDYAIWLMNADGSNPVQRAEEQNCANPAWSPTGQWIAYDADQYGDGFKEVWRMSPDGGLHTWVVDPADPNTDAWARSWSPDGAYIAYSQVSWIYFYGQWFWTSGYLYAVDWIGMGVTPLSTSGLDWYPDLQNADIWPPSSSVLPLPAGSPSPILVQWSGTDPGGSGIASYDLQVRDGEFGPWENWLQQTPETSDYYPGQGGHTYYFRSRAWDRAGQGEDWPEDYDAFTTVDSLPPETAVKPLPRFSPRRFLVEWGGTDPGGSGIEAYSVQVSICTPGDWGYWRTLTPDTWGIMEAEPGQTYYFRSSGVDRAGNEEPWPPGSGDAWTSAYSSRLSGTVRDNAGTPVGGAAVSVVPDPLGADPSDPDGAYAVYVGLAGGTYSVTWDKAGYGPLPAAEFDTQRDAGFDAVLPPPDNVVADWGFESGGLEPSWLPGGAYPPAAAAEARHTGAFGAALGVPLTWQPAFSVSSQENIAMEKALAAGSQGTAHLLWNAWNPDRLVYRQRQPDGTWSAVETVYTFPGYAGVGRLAVDPSGTPHAVWLGGSYLDRQVYYSSRAGGAWAAPAALSSGPSLAYPPEMDVTPDGAVHVAWNGGPLYYTRREPGGAWSAPQPITEPDLPNAWTLAAGADGSLHVVWYASDAGIFHTRRDAGGAWGGAQELAPAWTWITDLDLAVDGLGNAHVAWVDDNLDSLIYRRRSQAGLWSPAAAISMAGDVVSAADLAADGLGTAHAMWGGNQALYHAWKQGEASWSAAESLPGHTVWTAPAIAAGAEGVAYAAWGAYGAGTDILRAARWEGGLWSEPADVWEDAQVGELAAGIGLAVDALGGAHLAWESPHPLQASRELLYLSSVPVGQAGESSLSQEVTVPAVQPPVLSFLFRLTGASADRGAGLLVTLDDGTGPVPLLSVQQGSAGWDQASLDLAPWAGQEVTLAFAVAEAAGCAPALLALDEVTLGGALPDVWVSAGGQTSALPGEPVALVLALGNRGGASAAGVALTAVLPEGLAYVSADPPPTTIDPVLTWEVGDLAAHSGPVTVLLTARAGPDAPLGTTLPVEAAVSTLTPELETGNNQAAAGVWIGRRLCLPILRRQW